jgi:cytidine deaminase
LHTGCNVENAAFPEGTCAEANAIGSMVAAGGKRIVAIAAVGGADEIEACTPCGGCRQCILEFADENTRIFLIGEGNRIDSYSINELLPVAFRLR